MTCGGGNGNSDEEDTDDSMEPTMTTSVTITEISNDNDDDRKDEKVLKTLMVTLTRMTMPVSMTEMEIESKSYCKGGRWENNGACDCANSDDCDISQNGTDKPLKMTVMAKI